MLTSSCEALTGAPLIPFAHWALQVLAAVPASVPAATLPSAATSPMEHPITWGDYLFFGGMFAWTVFAIAAIIKWDVFRASRCVQRRAGRPRLLPVACGTLILYFALQIIALQAGLALHLFSEKALGITHRPSPSITVEPDATGPATTSIQPATATAPASAPEDEEGRADAAMRNTIEQMHLQMMAVGTELLACLFVVFLCHVLTVGGLRGLGLSPEQLPRGLLLGMLAFLLIYPVLWFDNLIVSNVYDQVGHKETIHETVKEIASTPDFNIRLVFALIAGIGAPLAEEFFFRGLLQTALIQRGWGFIVKFPPDREYSPPPYQRWAAIVICSLLFCALHSPDHFPILFILSLALGYVYERTGNLWASIALHAAFNWSTLLMLLWSGGDVVQ